MTRLASLLAILGLSLATPAVAEGLQQRPATMICGSLEFVRDMLKDKYGELPTQGGGILTDSMILTIFASKGGATWTMVRVDTAGEACIIAGGKDWIEGTTPPAGDPA